MQLQKTSSDRHTGVMDIGMTMSEVASTRRLTLQTLIINKSLWHDRVIGEWIPDSSFDRASPIINVNTTQSHFLAIFGAILETVTWEPLLELTWNDSFLFTNICLLFIAM